MTDDNVREATRRTVLAAALAAVLPAEGIARATSTTELTAATPTDVGSPSTAVFPQGVASGDPTRTGAVVWTRVAPDAVTDGTPLRLTVARDETFEDTVGSWRVPTDELDAHDNTVKVDLDGELTPGSRFAYRFDYDGAASPTGHCRTLPAADASPASVRLGLATCQDYRRGYYGAYHHLAQESVDFLVHLGDFISEHGGGGEYPDRSLSLPSGNGIASGLDDYRYLHRTYRTDEFLQAALAAHTLVPIWDDHEIVTNRYWDYEEGRPYAGRGDHPRNGDPEFMSKLFADGIRAWWEYTPTRVAYDPDADSLLDQLDLWRQFDFGDLLTLLVTDERLYRTSPTAGTQFGAEVGADSTVELNETMLGTAQREWFTEALSGAETTWTAWANEVLAMEFDLDLGGVDLLNADAWDGFAAERRLVLDSAAASDSRLVTLTGDMHTALAGHVELDGDRVGVEFMTPAVTSQNLRTLLGLPNNQTTRQLLEQYVTDYNPHVEFFDSHHWGYSVVEFTPAACTYEAYAVDKTDPSTDADRQLLARLRCPADRYDLDRLA